MQYLPQCRQPGPEALPSYVRLRGNAHLRGPEVKPDVPRIFSRVLPFDSAFSSKKKTSGRRLALAKWITDPGNPATARVMANRIFQYHFGRPLAGTPNDFGRLGLPPTHPELLDWLAGELVDGGWKLKRLHRMIMLSSTYRMSSRRGPGAIERDPTNRLLANFDMRRLTAEEMRDSILSLSGELNLALGGPSVYPPLPREVLETASRPDQAWKKSSREEAARRSLYIHVKRSLLHPLLTSFDLADTDASCPVRFVTTQPTQALTMLNSEFVNEQAERFASRIREECGHDPETQVPYALRLALAREPNSDEIARGVDLIRELIRDEGMDASRALADFCLLIFNLNEFAYLK